MSGFLPELGGIVAQRVGAVGGREDVAVVDDGATAEGFALVPVRAQGLNQANLQRIGSHLLQGLFYVHLIASIAILKSKQYLVHNICPQ